MEKDFSVTAVVVTYWTGPVLFQCLKSIHKQEFLKKIVVINNGNPKKTSLRLDKLAKQENKIDVIKTKRNLGYSAACNIGANYANGEFLAFTNPDCILPEDTFSNIFRAIEKQKKVWICGGNLQNPDGTQQRGGRREILSPWNAIVDVFRLYYLFPKHPMFQPVDLHREKLSKKITDVTVISGAFMIVRTEKFHLLGGFDKKMFLHFEDIDFCIRTKQLGGRIIIFGNTPVTHIKGTSNAPKFMTEFFKTKSAVYYFFKHFNMVYPKWSLVILASILWLRYLVKTLLFFPSDVVLCLKRIGS